MTGLVMTSSGSGYTVVVWLYGASLGGYHYTLRMSIYHVVRARSVLSTAGQRRSAKISQCPKLLKMSTVLSEIRLRIYYGTMIYVYDGHLNTVDMKGHLFAKIIHNHCYS